MPSSAISINKKASAKKCKGFLNDYFGSKQVDFFSQLESTSQAAKLASEEVGTAALCSHIAAKIYNVPILFDNIQDNESNQTRFYILSKVDNLKLSIKDKTTLAVKLKNDDKPGALLGLLQDFESHGLTRTHPANAPRWLHLAPEKAYHRVQAGVQHLSGRG